MTVTVQIKLDASEARRYLRIAAPKAVSKATSRGLNKGIMQVRTISIDEVAQERNLLKTVIRQASRIRKSNPNTLTATLTMTGRPIPLKAYGAKVQGQRGRGNKKRVGPGASPVSVAIRKGRRRVVAGAFIGPGGHVYKRKGRARLPIKKLYGPSLPSAFVKPIVNRAMTRVARTKVPGLIEHELTRELRRAR